MVPKRGLQSSAAAASHHAKHGGAAPLLLLLLLLLLLIISFPTASSTPILGLDAFLATQYRLDPAATNDSFPSLPSSLKSALSSFPDQRDHRHLISSLLSLSVYVPVQVVLVGSAFPKASSSLLSAFLASFPASRFHVISPFSSDSHTLSLSHSPQLHVSDAPPSLATSLADSISSSLSQSPSNFRSSLASIPHSPVDELVRSHFESSTKSDSTSSAVYLYFLDVGPQSRPYAYNYAPGNPDPFSPAVTKCLGTIWTGHDRYAWIDLGAGPVDYGPAVSGDGVLPKGDFHPLATLHGKTRSGKGTIADVASITWSAYQVLLTPSLRIPVHFENSWIVQFVHVLSGEGKSGGFDWRNVERSFMDEVNSNGLLLRGQSIRFTYYTVKYSKCTICSYAIARATNSYTSRFLFDNYTLIVSEYLDSKRLHQVILDSTDEFRRLAGIPEDDDFARLLPVYIFDLDTTGVFLLDRYHQAVSFKDMVVAVRTKNTQTVSEYSCNGRHVFLQTRDLERPLVGSILQSMWGVSPTHLLWSPIHNITHVDYTWSVGNTPFGPFSELSSLNFVQKDAARRNLLFMTLNYSITSAIDVLESVISHGGEKYLLRHNQNKQFTQRWNLFKHKLYKAISALWHYDFEMAFYYMRSSDHDLYGMHDIVYRASQELEASLVCFQEPPFPWFPITMSSAAVGCLLYVWTKRDRLFRNKRKQF